MLRRAMAQQGGRVKKSERPQRIAHDPHRQGPAQSKGAEPRGPAPSPVVRNRQAATDDSDALRRRIAKPTRPKPVISIAQVAGSGTAFPFTK